MFEDVDIESPMVTLRDPSLLADKLFVDGQWRDSRRGSRFAVVNPANQQAICEVADAGSGDVDEAVDSADIAFASWRRSSPDQRSGILRTIAGSLRENAEDLAVIMTAEMGKPLSESVVEVEISARWYEWFAEEAKRINGEVVSTQITSARFFTIRQPVGVAALITPWNSPMFSIARKMAPALASGCTTILKPSEETPLTALAFGVLAESAGVPVGVINILPTSKSKVEEVGQAITGNPKVRKLSFTGSTKVGRKLMEQSAPYVRNLSLELGGNSPLIVFEDADMDKAITGAMVSKFGYSGQRCVANNRILVHRNVHDEFVRRLKERVGELQVGPGLRPGVDVGPVISVRAAQNIQRLIEEAASKGADVYSVSHKPGPAFVAPSVVSNATREMEVAQTEVFGPVAVVYQFEDEDQAIAMANDTVFGLAAYVFTESIGRAWRVTEALDAGTVLVNTGAWTTEHIAFGGMKQSGLGREGGSAGIDEYLETKAVRMEL